MDSNAVVSADVGASSVLGRHCGSGLPIVGEDDPVAGGRGELCQPEVG